MSLPQSLFGITGLTVGGVGIWGVFLLAAGTAFRSWVIGMADRKRAANEGESIDEKAAAEARAQLFTQMQEQMTAMAREIANLKARVAELEANERNNLTELIELRGAKQVESRVRQRTQEIVSAERVNGGQG